jgi:hypothetical protein
MNMEQGYCRICNTFTEVRNVNLYITGSEGLWACRKCEKKILRFIRALQRHYTDKRLQEIKERRRGDDTNDG